MNRKEFIDKWKLQGMGRAKFDFSDELNRDLDSLEQSHEAELKKAFYAGMIKGDGITPNKEPNFNEWYKKHHKE